MRDPRVDPKAGDLVFGRSGMIRHVLRIDHADAPFPKVIFHAQRNGGDPKRQGQYLQWWRAWCERNAVDARASE